MTAAAAAPVPPRRVPLAAVARLLRLELRRNVMPWLLPVLAALFWLTTYRPAVAGPALWNVRSGMLQAQTMLAFAPLLAGVAAWTGSREGRRGTGDLVGITGLPRWTGQLASCAAVTCWAEAAYLAGVGVVYGVTARQATWGGPLWWPVAVGAATAAAAGAVGFAAGSLAPSRFTPPLAAVAVFLALGGGALGLEHNSTFAQIWPLNVQGPFPSDAYGIFFPYLPDLAIAQLMFVAGLGAAALGTLGLPARAGGPWLRGAAVAVTIAGLGSAGTAVGLAGTARVAPHGIVIPALHDAASDRPVSYVPVCARGVIPVCLQPAYRHYLPEVTAALGPVLRELAGLPGAPVRVTQVAVTSAEAMPGNGIALGGPVQRDGVIDLPLSGLPLPGKGVTTAEFVFRLRMSLAPLVNAFVGVPGGGSGLPPGVAAQAARPGVQAQVAVSLALIQDAGLDGRLPATSAVEAAARRFAALPAAARHAWLAGHLAALRAGHVALGELP